jgi:hypothetical protein
MKYIPTDELVSKLEEVALKLHAQEDRDIVMLCVDRINSIEGNRDYLRQRVSMCEHIIGGMYVDQYECC